MADKYRTQWEQLGEQDPYWAVLTNPEKRGSRWEAHEFFETGRAEINHIFWRLDNDGIQVRCETALDFGCGVGRLSRALAEKFTRVLAVDVSSTMLAEAAKANEHIENIEFLNNAPRDLSILPDSVADFLYSNIVLQHIPRDRQAAFILEFHRVLKPGGILVFQTPARRKLDSLKGLAYIVFGNRPLNLARKIRYWSKAVMEVHVFPSRDVQATLDAAGFNLLATERYDSAGPGFESYMYYARKETPVTVRAFPADA